MQVLQTIEQEPGFLGSAVDRSSSAWEACPLEKSKSLFFKKLKADETVISEQKYQQPFDNVSLKPRNRRLQGPNGKALRISGTARLRSKLNGREGVEDVYVLPHHRTALFGKPGIPHFGRSNLFNSVSALNVEKDIPKVLYG